jgi:hypothetical protein
LAESGGSCDELLLSKLTGLNAAGYRGDEIFDFRFSIFDLGFGIFWGITDLKRGTVR